MLISVVMERMMPIISSVPSTLIITLPEAAAIDSVVGVLLCCVREDSELLVRSIHFDDWIVCSVFE